MSFVILSLDIKEHRMKTEKIYRDKSGVVHIEAIHQLELYKKLGYVHAIDRGMQMLLMRILGEGRAAELLDNSLEHIDIFFRKMNWSGNIDLEIAKLNSDSLEIAKAYCEGANEAFEEKLPWETKLLKIPFEKWEVKNIILISRMVGYLTLTQSQAEVEKLFVEMVQADVPQSMLNELFPKLLKGLDIKLLKKVKLEERIVEPSDLWNLAIPRMMASNNWVISNKKTESGDAIMANDPHLEINRLPGIWYETVLKAPDSYLMGGTMPGVPAVLTGRNDNLSWGVTYTFADTVDSWVENCKDGKYKKGSKWFSFEERTETIKRKKKDDLKITFYENEHGVLEGNPNEEGFYLASKWSASISGGESMNALVNLSKSNTVKEGMNAIVKLETSWNYVFADKKGNIGYQMTGLVPKRASGVSGFVPLPGWTSSNNWKGFVSKTEMPKSYNPKEGFFVTANNDLNKYGKTTVINMPMGSYRADRIAQILKESKKINVEKIKNMHMDVYSLQAEKFMKILSPLLPSTKQGEILKSWNCEYDLESKGAYLFEQFYHALIKKVFGDHGFGKKVIAHLKNQTGIFIDFYANFDAILLKNKSTWFNKKTREEIYSEVIEESLNCSVKKWKDVQKVILSNIVFGGKLPKFLGFDKGPILLKGGRSTIHQGQIYKSAGRDTTFAPSIRLIADMGTNILETTLPGGPSDRRFSYWYANEIDDWVKGNYKIIDPNYKNNKKYKL